MSKDVVAGDVRAGRLAIANLPASDAEIVTPWGNKPAGSLIRRRHINFSPNSRLGHCNK
jgi:hypothetical protein